MLNLTSTLLQKSDGHAIVKFAGPNAGKAFQHESGKHCCQRVPRTESRGRKHTSMVSVGVLPIKKDVHEPLREEDLEITTCRGHGPGGQHQNKTDSAVRVRHIPTGVTVCINGRDQHANKRAALEILTAKVNDQRAADNDAAYAEFRRGQMGDGARSGRVRTYNFVGSRVVDHRLKRKTGWIERVMKGEFQLLFGYKG